MVLSRIAVWLLRATRAALLVCVTVASLCSGLDAGSQPTWISLPSDNRFSSPDWWPRKGTAPRSEYVGNAACAECHAEKVATQAKTGMGLAAMTADKAPQLRNHPELAFQLGTYNYSLRTAAEGSTYSLTNGSGKVTHPLEWALGRGDFGQTYVYSDSGKFYESHLSFYTKIDKLDITPGHVRSLPTSIDVAAGRVMSPREAQECLGCHTTAATVANEFDPEHAMMGVTCEACHGPGRNHVAAEMAGIEGAASLITNPAHLSPEDALDFCGSCHRSFGDTITNGWNKIGVPNARFQPYRLEKSKCWGNGDARLRCQSCHDPHVPLEENSVAYDGSCLACHVNTPGAKPTQEHPGAACKVAQKNCVSCHMPQVELPGAHTAFTDHWIRIVKPGAPYPE